MNNLWVLCVLFFGIVTSYPAKNGFFIPQRSVIFGGYYSNPLFDYASDLVPQGSMSAFVTKDSAAPNHFANEDIPIVELEQDEDRLPNTEQNENAEEEPNFQHKIPDIVPQSITDDEATTAKHISTDTSSINKPPGNKILKKKPAVYETENKKELPEKTNGGNVYFPISIGGYRGSSNGRAGADDELYFPSSAVAIANAYSTGQGGVATSHATSFGDPYFASGLRRNNFSPKSNKN